MDVYPTSRNNEIGDLLCEVLVGELEVRDRMERLDMLQVDGHDG